MDVVTTHFINGQNYIDPNEPVSPLMNPASGKPIGKVAYASEATCLQALQAAEQAFSSWSLTTPGQRARILFDFRALLIARQAQLVKLITQEQGKTLEDAKGSVMRGIELIEWYCGLVSHWQMPLTTQAASEIDCYTLRQPLGVCVGVSPFNFPVMVPLWMMIPAIACGNTFILKPSEQDPSAAVRLAQWLTEVGLPNGVVNVIHGGKESVETLITHPIVQCVTAVASTQVAEAIYQQAVRLNKRSHTFGGAKNHAVVMEDANMQETAKAIVGAAFGSAGQRCMALSAVVVVGEETEQALLSALIPLIKAIKVGGGEEPGMEMGPLISAAHRAKVVAAIDKGVAEGARLLIDGRGFRSAHFPEGYFLGPTLFGEVTAEMSIYQNEIFGPVLVVARMNTFDEAIALVNQHPLGNGSAIFTRDGGLARAYAQRVNAGMIGVNIPIPVPIVSHPFGGWKRSSFGDTPMHGMESLHFYTRQKSVTVKWPSSTHLGSAFVMPTHD
jgi:malonate-semialdehyde dehydrogenase (acetylating) / methylmalonate-semialdehyde dehydrogenase